MAWISDHIIGNHDTKSFKTDRATFTNSLRSVRDTHHRSDVAMFSAVSMHQTGSAAHLMPTILAVTFVSNVTGNGIPQLRNQLYKTLAEPIPTLQSILGPLGMGINVPAVYVELSQVVYNLRLQSQRSSSHGNEQFLYSVADLEKRIQLQVKNPPNCELLPVLQFMNQVSI